MGTTSVVASEFMDVPEQEILGAGAVKVKSFLPNPAVPYLFPEYTFSLRGVPICRWIRPSPPPHTDSSPRKDVPLSLQLSYLL